MRGIRLALPAAGVACLALAMSSLAAQRPTDRRIYASLANDGPLLEGEPLRVGVVFKNDSPNRPFNYVSVLEAGPPDPILFTVTREKDGEVVGAGRIAADEPRFTSENFRQLRTGGTRYWELTLPENLELKAGESYEVVLRYKALDMNLNIELNLSPVKTASNPIYAVPSTEPAVFSRRRSLPGGTEDAPTADRIVFVRAGWLASYLEDPRTGTRREFHKIARVGRARPVLFCDGVNGELHMIFQDAGGNAERTYFCVGPRDEILVRKVVDARTTFVKLPEGAVVLQVAAQPPAHPENSRETAADGEGDRSE